MAPAAQASLISYLWLLFAVLFSALLVGRRWRARHLLGTGLGLAAVGLLAADTGGLALDPGAWRSYGLALGAAVVWAAYTTISSQLTAVPPETTYGFCLCVAALAAAVHFMTEATIAPLGAERWLRLVVIGVGPAGLAFAAWDFGLRRGDMRALTVVSYAIPVLSTLVLVVFHLAVPTASLAVACALIAVAGAVAAPRSSAPASG